MNILTQLAVLILLQDLEDKSPDYIAEKMDLLSCRPLDALGALDSVNLARFVQYCEMWRVDVPQEIRNAIKAYGITFGE